MPKLRLNKILAQAGLTSRRGADRFIVDGRVAVNGIVTRELGTLADPAVDVVTVDGRAVPAAETHRYVLLHKPRGYVTTRSDPQGRRVVTDLVSGSERVYPVGRLDADVEGVLLLTNDGELTHRLLHPRYELPRVYEADVAGDVSRGDLVRWRAGVTLDDGPAIPLAVELADTRAPRTAPRAPHGEVRCRLVLTFAEGRKHEVKRYCAALGHPIVRLRRVAFGPITLGDLRPGASRDLSSREVAALRRTVQDAPPRRSQRRPRRSQRRPRRSQRRPRRSR
jgi:pseudouridine synthase